MDSDEPKDWEEVREEAVPEQLKRKWIVEEHFGEKLTACPSCGKLTPRDGLTCLFCDARLNEDTGLLGKLLKWLKGS
ncbi:MAG TPA: hypothetical protein PKL97_01900 [Candidatus Omnitrophota bacterium]|nr:hypothetical protein [Candidatus Omnitrophota bacterium]